MWDFSEYVVFVKQFEIVTHAQNNFTSGMYGRVGKQILSFLCCEGNYVSRDDDVYANLILIL